MIVLPSIRAFDSATSAERRSISYGLSLLSVAMLAILMYVPSLDEDGSDINDVEE